MVGDAVAAFLHFGYLPRLEPTPTVLTRVLEARAGSPPPSSAVDEHQLVEAGARALRSCFHSPEGRLHVVPLSGGLDSRALLAGLLEAGVGDRVVTVTYGTPGTFDFEIAGQVAARAGVAHEAIDLTQVRLDAGALEQTLVGSDAAGWAFDLFFHRLIPARFGRDATYWSGFMSGVLSGAHVPEEPDRSWSAALQRFASGARFCRYEQLTPVGFAGQQVLPAEPWCDPDVLSFGDQLDVGIRQESYVRRTLLPDGYDYRTPFMNHSWLDFMFGVPLSWRRGQRLFKQILTATFPALFALPAKNTAGLSVGARPELVAAKIRLLKLAASIRAGSLGRDLRRRRFPVPFGMLNYLDFPAALRSRSDVRALVADLVGALDDRGTVAWVRARDLWAAHERAGGDPDLACALTLLASLELNLRADAARARPLFVQAR